ncbi:MAG TPA: hypothetical protein VFB80_00915 [Pirellulaceae bacterium]|nr:hypothetical protein [Pirellulaceae bacterium]
MRPNSSLVALAAACLLAGCQSMPAPHWHAPEQPKVTESKFSRPVRLAVIWSPALLNTPGGKPTRGFGGRIYFYDTDNNAVPVEGQLIVYGYNNKPGAGTKMPDRKFAFTPEQFTAHFSPTDLGASYSVWLPWDEVGNEQVEVSLVPIFTAASGQLIVGQSHGLLLPGPTTENAATQFDHRKLGMNEMVRRPYPGQPAMPGVQQASYLAPPVASNLPPSARERELTIKLSGSLAERIAAAPLPPGPQVEAAARERATAAILAALKTAQPAPSTAAQPNAAPTAAPPAAPPRPWSPTNQPSARFLRPTLPDPSSPGLPPVAGRLPTRPSP